MKTEKLMENGIIFNEKPEAIPYNYRISYKVSILVMIIKLCCGRKGCSLIKFQIISRAISDEKFSKELFTILYDGNQTRSMVVRFDASVNRALQYAVQDGLIIQQANRLYRLDSKGKRLANMIMNENVMSKEKVRLLEIGEKLTEDLINNIIRKWS